MKPKTVTARDIVFGGNMKELLPDYNIIPQEFKRFGGTKWNKITEQWFFQGLPQGTEFIPRAGVDGQSALKHIRAIMASFEPKHEHKDAGVSYLMSLWFEDVILGRVKP